MEGESDGDEANDEIETRAGDNNRDLENKMLYAVVDDAERLRRDVDDLKIIVASLTHR